MSFAKVELHAHLNGSLTPQIIRQLDRSRSQRGRAPIDIPRWISDVETSLETFRRTCDLRTVFKLFPVVQALTDDAESLAEATELVVKAFAEDNVKYLELRTSPKDIPGKMSERVYATTVLDVLRRVNADPGLDIHTGLLLSIDRSKDLAKAERTVDLAIQLRAEGYSDILVGMDFSGDPDLNDARTFIPCLSRAKEAGLKLAIHLAEVPEMEDEIEAVLREGLADRIGHGTCLHPTLGGNVTLWDLLIKSCVPVEVCLTSNVMTRSVPSYEEHHVRFLHDLGHPFCVCTDDTGIFFTDLSREMEHCRKALKLGDDQVKDLSLNALNYSFASDTIKAKIRTKL